MRRVAVVLGVILLGTIIYAGIEVRALIQEVPPLDSLAEYRPFQTTYFYDTDKNIIGCVAAEWRDVLPDDTIINLQVARAVIAIEDERFFKRSAPLDLQSIARASLKNWEAGRIVEGGSTIEQQLVKQLLPPQERKEKSLQRKLKEIVLGFQLVRGFSKERILALYLNEAYLGHNRNGVEAAALFYFNKHATNLSLSEAATIAGMIHAPEIVSPRKHPEAARERRNTVLWKMYALKMISTETYHQTLEESITLSLEFSVRCNKEPYVVEHARKELKRKF